MVGTGLMADLIIKDFSLTQNTELAAIVSRDPAAAAGKFARWGVPPVKVLAHLDEALADPTIDLIYVAAPHSEHHPMTKAALEAGKHVLCEKAFTMDAAEARDLAQTARSRGLFLMEALWTKFNPLMNELKRRVEAGEIGKLKLIETHFGFNRVFNPAHRLFSAELGGGSTLDQGVYTTSIIDWFADSDLLQLRTSGELYANGTDARQTTKFYYANGVIGVGSSALNATYGTTARICGEDAYIDIEGQFWSPTAATLTRIGEADELLTERIHVPKVGAGYTHMITEVSQAIIDGKTECARRTLDESIRIMSMLDQIREQLRSNS